MINYSSKRIRFFPTFFLVFFLSFLNVIKASGQANPVANLLFLYNPKCQECQQLMEQDFPALLSSYKGQVEILAIDVSVSANQNLVERLKEKYTFSVEQVPILIIGDSVFIGRQQITTDLNIHVQEVINNGGASYPFLVNPSAESQDWILYTTLICISLILFLFLIVPVFRLRSEKSKLNKQISEQKKTIEKISKQVQNLTAQNKNLDEELKRMSEKIDPTMDVLLGISGSPVDLLSEAQRILYYKDKRPVEDSIKDVNGYLISLLRNVVSALGIKPIASYLQIVAFDERYHVCFQPVLQGEKVRVLETGWARSNTVLKRALVEKI